jgi:hypothetical protein
VPNMSGHVLAHCSRRSPSRDRQLEVGPESRTALISGSGATSVPCPGNDRPARSSAAPAPQADSTLITALVTEMLADPGGFVTRGWLALRPADIEIETEIVVLSTF